MDKHRRTHDNIRGVQRLPITWSRQTDGYKEKQEQAQFKKRHMQFWRTFRKKRENISVMWKTGDMCLEISMEARVTGRGDPTTKRNKYGTPHPQTPLWPVGPPGLD